MPDWCSGMKFHKLDQQQTLVSDMVDQNLISESAVVGLESLAVPHKVGKDLVLVLNKAVLQEPSDLVDRGSLGLLDQITFGLADHVAFGLGDHVAFGLTGQKAFGLGDQMALDLAD